MQLAGINRVRGIVIIDPVVHLCRRPVKQRFRSRNRQVCDALNCPASDVHCRQCPVPNRKVHREQSQVRQSSPDLDTPDRSAARGRSRRFRPSLNPLIADAFALYLKTKNFHWHVSGRHFRDYHLMLDEQSEAIFAHHRRPRRARPQDRRHHMRSIGQVAKQQTIQDNNESYVPPREMLRELMEDNKNTWSTMRKAHEIADEYDDSGNPRFWRTSSTRPNAAPGSCSKPAARKAATRRNGCRRYQAGKAGCRAMPADTVCLHQAGAAQCPPLHLPHFSSSTTSPAAHRRPSPDRSSAASPAGIVFSALA